LKATAKEPEEIVPALHSPIVTEELFNEVQDILSGKKKIMAVIVAVLMILRVQVSIMLNQVRLLV
jgi:hypothetical protein